MRSIAGLRGTQLCVEMLGGRLSCSFGACGFNHMLPAWWILKKRDILRLMKPKGKAWKACRRPEALRKLVRAKLVTRVDGQLEMCPRAGGKPMKKEADLLKPMDPPPSAKELEELLFREAARASELGQSGGGCPEKESNASKMIEISE